MGCEKIGKRGGMTTRRGKYFIFDTYIIHHMGEFWLPSGHSINEYATGHGVLNDFSSEFYRDTMRLCRPIVSGESIIKHTKAGVTIRSIDKILNLSYEDQDNLLEFLTELVVDKRERDENWEKFMQSLIEKIMSKPAFKAHFDALESYFNKLNYTQRMQVLSLSINKLNCGIESIRREISSRLWDKKANVKELMVIDQVLYFFQNVINSLPTGGRIKKSEKKRYNRIMGFSGYLILRLEAYRRGKISLDDLNDDLSLSRMLEPNEKYIKPSEYKLAFEVFGG